MHRKRLLAAILLVLLLCGCLTGCGPAEPNRAVPTAAQRQTEAASTAAPATESVPATLPAAPTSEPETLPTTVPSSEPVTLPDGEDPAQTEESAPEPTRPLETAPVSEPEETKAPDRGTPTEPSEEPEAAPETEAAVRYIANTNTKKFHYPSCSSVSDMKEENKWYFTGTREELIEQGYVPCKRCKP